MNNEIAPICEVLRLLRISQDISIKELSRLTGISASYITEIESGRKNKPSFSIIEKYSKALDVSKSAIMFFEEEYSEKNLNYQKMLLYMLKTISEKKPC